MNAVQEPLIFQDDDIRVGICATSTPAASLDIHDGKAGVLVFLDENAVLSAPPPSAVLYVGKSWRSGGELSRIGMVIGGLMVGAVIANSIVVGLTMGKGIMLIMGLFLMANHFRRYLLK